MTTQSVWWRSNKETLEKSLIIIAAILSLIVLMALVTSYMARERLFFSIEAESEMTDNGLKVYEAITLKGYYCQTSFDCYLVGLVMMTSPKQFVNKYDDVYIAALQQAGRNGLRVLDQPLMYRMLTFDHFESALPLKNDDEKRQFFQEMSVVTRERLIKIDEEVERQDIEPLRNSFEKSYYSLLPTGQKVVN